MSEGRLTHFDEQGRGRMVDVSAKPVTLRRAVAAGRVVMQPTTVNAIREGMIGKGDVLGVARVAGIMGSKRTSDLVPMCHPIGLDAVEIAFELVEDGVLIEATALATARTGVEMEALTAVSVAALTIYDMCKSIDRAMAVDGICLMEKSGGRSGHYRREEEPGRGDR